MRAIVCSVFAVTLVHSTAPAESAPVKAMAAISACRTEPNDIKRLACYDAAVGPFTDAVAKGDVKVLDREEVRQTRRGLFGFQLPRLPFFSGDDSFKDTPTEIETMLTSAQEIGGGNWSLTMADGAVWRTVELLPRDPRIGVSIKIKAGALGSYFLSVGTIRPVRALRVK